MYTLYHYWRSSASWRVRWGLNLKKVPYQAVAVNLLEGKEKEVDYKTKNPAGYVPCLLVGENPIGESLAILEWLEENHPTPSFFSKDSFERAKIRQLAETVNSGIQPLHNLDVMRKYSHQESEQAAWAKYWIERGLGVYETVLSSVDRKGKKFSVSNEPSLADICLIPQCYSALRFQVDLAAFPQIKSIYEYALSTEACAKASAEAHKPS